MSADDELLAMLKTVPHLNVWDGDVDADKTTKVIAVPLPYVAFYSTPGYDRDERAGGQVGGRVLEFDIHGVGENRAQAKAALDKARGVLSRKFLNGNIIIRSAANLPVDKEPTYTRPGGAPLFFGVDRYSVAI